MSRNSALAGSTLGHLSGLGVQHFVVCAGARNAPLVTSLLSTSEKKGFRIWHYFDERTAAFFALGLARSRQEPVAVLTTSGTAAAELLPAAIEGYYAGVPLILVTADRPEWYRGSGAPQAIEQKGLYGVYTPVSIDVQSTRDLSWVTKWDRKAPLHLNICLEEPDPADRVSKFKTVVVPEPKEMSHEAAGSQVAEFLSGRQRTIALLGALPESWQEPVEQFLADLGVPVWAESTSGLRESEALKGQLIRQESEINGLNPDCILRIGGVPSLRFWRDLETQRGIDVMSVVTRPFSGLARDSDWVVCEKFPEGVSTVQEGRIDRATLSDAKDLEVLLDALPKSEPAMVRSLAEVIPGDAMVFLGNSLPIREWNLVAPHEPAHPRCFANRGANGIDGEVATFLGMSQGEEEAWGIFGDLTALYDLNAPGMISQLQQGRRRIVVLNNGGGRIFSRLPSLSGLSKEDKKVTENHHRQRFESWAAMWGLGYAIWRPGKPAPEISGDTVLIEILLETVPTELFWKELK